MDEKARKGGRLNRPMGQSFLQHVAASGMLLGQASTASDSKEAWRLLASARSRWLSGCGWKGDWKMA
eukprot:14623986-Alexandrium_andersonii.AAC.1